MTSTKSCLFCGKTGVPLTKEHAIPRWISKLIDTRNYGGLTQTTVTQQGIMPWRLRSPEFDLQIRQVCAPCNNRWLSDLERSFRLVVSPALLGGQAPEPLNRRAQRIVAVWALKTYLLTEYASASRPHRTRQMEGRADLLRYLRAEGRPHIPASVWIGAVDWTSEGLAMSIGMRKVTDESGVLVGSIGIISIAAWVFGIYLAGWAKGTPKPNAFVGLEGVPPQLARYFKQIWPSEADEVHWPPSVVMSTDELKAVVMTGEPIVVAVQD